MTDEYYASKGIWNRVALEWFYFFTGLNTFNDLKYLALAGIGLYYSIKYPQIAIPAIIVLGPLILLLGRIKIKYIAKRIDWLGVTEGTKVANHTYELQQETVAELKENNRLLRELLKK